MNTVKFFVQSVYFLERTILGLKMEIRGAENVPEDGAFIVAAKHQSAYETFKLHVLFENPTIILKKELLRIPLWGQYLAKSDPIAIDRKDPKGASYSVRQGAIRVAEQGRPIIIFPQGTRVNAEQTSAERPYKNGVAKMQEATNLPIIPLAINAGVFWPKHKWVKRGGTAIFSFLEPIPPGRPREQVMKQIEEQVEAESIKLAQEAKSEIADNESKGSKVLWPLFLIASIVLLFTGYSYAWFEVAKSTKAQYIELLANASDQRLKLNEPTLSGYPGKIRLEVAEQHIQNMGGSLHYKNLVIEGWPFPFTPAHIKTDEITINHLRWKKPIVFSSLNAKVSFEIDKLNILHGVLSRDEFKTSLTGIHGLGVSEYPEFDLMLSVEGASSFLNTLSDAGILKPEISFMLGAAFSSFADQHGVTRIPVYQKNGKLFAGPIALFEFIPYRPQAPARARQPLPVQ